MTQKERILKHLKTRKTITRYEAAFRYGCMNLWARISELKDDGHKIGGYMVDKKNRFGDKTQVMSYYLAR